MNKILNKISKKKLNDFFECEQDFNQPFWQDPVIVKIYLKSIKLGLDIPTADAYVELYRVTNKVYDIRTFRKVMTKLELSGFDIFEVDKENSNETYLYLKKLLKL